MRRLESNDSGNFKQIVAAQPLHQTTRRRQPIGDGRSGAESGQLDTAASVRPCRFTASRAVTDQGSGGWHGRCHLAVPDHMRARPPGNAAVIWRHPFGNCFVSARGLGHFRDRCLGTVHRRQECRRPVGDDPPSLDRDSQSRGIGHAFVPPVGCSEGRWFLRFGGESIGVPTQLQKVRGSRTANW
jgi:hypothetical protein